MRKTVVGIFAHPDDEAFGPGGTLAKLAKDNDVYLLCATKGEAARSPSLRSGVSGRGKKLGEIRAKELRRSAKILGVKKVYFLGFIDGTLSNNLYHKLALKIKKYLEKLKPETIITFEPQGVSGHIDHIVVSFVTSFVFWKLPFIKNLWQFSRLYSKERFEKQDYFIYFPKGYKKEEIDKVVKTDDVWEIKLKAMMCHKSQLHDIKRILSFQEKLPKEEYFLVTRKY